MKSRLCVCDNVGPVLIAMIVIIATCKCSNEDANI